MYGLPDSAIIGTAKRVTNGIRGKLVKNDRDYVEFPTPFWDMVARKINQAADRRIEKQSRKAHFEKHGFYPAN